ncbi:MAG TPA: hypothetical protein PK875_01920 [Spirochaetota bacterium]|nr:MAG: hypothetical protein BWY96_02411 [Spirochaetes bacterium ADurb.BinA120]HPI13625.1 hypothetical protein [Spirochaetota bacterium]HPO44531.1 hypothetical protein [Spirochaetota bacterium]
MEWKLGPGMYAKVVGHNLIFKEPLKKESMIPLKIITGGVIESTSKAFGKIGRLKVLAGGTVAGQIEAPHESLKSVLEFLNSKEDLEKALSVPVESIPRNEVRKKSRLVIYGAILAFFVLVLICGKGDNDIPAAGEAGILSIGKSGTLLIAVDEKSFDDLSKAASIKNGALLGSLMMKNRLVSVDNDTRIKMIEPGVSKCKVMVTEGPQNGFTGWIASEFVKKIPSERTGKSR